ncbi:MAG: DUF1122 family protein [Candidatus Binataceae bacterium]
MSNVTESHTGSAETLARRIDGHQLTAIDTGIWRLVLSQLTPFRARVGWFYLAVTLAPADSESSLSPLMEGIVSGGGRGVRPWFECRLFPMVKAAGGDINTRALGLEAGLVDLLGALVPDGGHMMVDYETSGQADTHAELLLGVPPLATYLGALMFDAGFRGELKDWYFSEGGHEGPRKLQANKSPSPKAAAAAMRNHLTTLRTFVKRSGPAPQLSTDIFARAVARARSLLREYGTGPSHHGAEHTRRRRSLSEHASVTK